jgi:lipoic acid synthetase
LAQTRPRTPKPDWLKVRAPHGEPFFDLKQILRRRGLHTVCEEARCPNIGECWDGGTATFMIMGDVCTRGCSFCAVTTLKKGTPLDPLEPQKIADAVAEMDLDYIVLTTVDRDDLPDQGAAHCAATVRAVREAHPRIIQEVLFGDFQGNEDHIRTVVDAKPEVYGHNVETIRRLTPKVRDARCSYDQSLRVLELAKELDPGMYTKSSIMLGLGETEEEVVETMEDLRAIDVNILTLGQYLQPTFKHLDVETFVHPEQFDRYREIGESLGFLFVASGPLVRSSYRAGEYFMQNVIERDRAAKGHNA